MRVCLVASNRFPVAEPFAGGLEAMTHQLARALVKEGHEVTLFAGPGSDATLPVSLLAADPFAASEVALRDTHAPSQEWMADHHAYLALMLELARTGGERFDVVHNHSLHHLPVAMAELLDVPVLTTLHTPPLPWLESAVTASGVRSHFTAVSDATAAAWRPLVDARTVRNGVDTDHWTPGTVPSARGADGPAVWTGRLVPEKAPHDAIDAARAAGVPLVLAGPAPDPLYLDREVRPRLGDGVRYVGHLDHRDLVGLLRAASVALVTPAWEEPFGLVAAEALACGTPVAGYAVGGLPEVVTPEVGRLVAPRDVDALAAALLEARALDPRTARAHAVRELSARRMVAEYEALYAELAATPVAAA